MIGCGLAEIRFYGLFQKIIGNNRKKMNDSQTLFNTFISYSINLRSSMKVYITIVEIEDSASETRRLGIGGWSILSNISNVLFTPVVK